LQHIQEMFSDRVSILRHVVIPNLDDPPAVPFDPRRAPLVSLAIRVLAAIDFDDETMPY
jgi:hypothetical protein